MAKFATKGFRFIGSTWHWLLLALILVSLGLMNVGPGVAQSSPPSPSAVGATRVAAGSHAASSTSISYSTRSLDSTIHPLIRSAARRLENNPDRIYEFVRNGIELEPTFGLAKGAVGTLVNRSGNPFDQAELMVKLMRAAGYTARFRYGTMTLNGTQFNDWMGTTNVTAAQKILDDGGFPNDVSGSSSVTSVTVQWVWVEAQISGTWYQFNPAYKQHDWFDPADLKTMMGYNRTSLRAATNGYAWLSSPGPMQGLYDSVRSTLTGSTYAGQSTEEIYGGHRIRMSLHTSLRQTSLTEASGSTTWDEIPNTFRTQITTTGYKSSGTDVATLYGDDYYAQMYGSYDSSGAAPTAMAFLGLDMRPYVAGSSLSSMTCVASGACPTYSTISVKVDHPYPQDSGSYADETIAFVGPHVVQGQCMTFGGEIPNIRDDTFLAPTRIDLRLGGESVRANELLRRQLVGSGEAGRDLLTVWASDADNFTQGVSSSRIAAHHQLVVNQIQYTSHYEGYSSTCGDGGAVSNGGVVRNYYQWASINARSGSSSDGNAAWGAAAFLTDTMFRGDTGAFDGPSPDYVRQVNSSNAPGLSVDSATGLQVFTSPTLASTGSGSFPTKLELNAKVVDDPDGLRTFDSNSEYFVRHSAAPFWFGQRDPLEAIGSAVQAVIAMEENRGGSMDSLGQGLSLLAANLPTANVVTLVHGAAGMEQFVNSGGAWHGPAGDLAAVTVVGWTNYGTVTRTTADEVDLFTLGSGWAQNTSQGTVSDVLSGGVINTYNRTLPDAVLASSTSGFFDTVVAAFNGDHYAYGYDMPAGQKVWVERSDCRRVYKNSWSGGFKRCDNLKTFFTDKSAPAQIITIDPYDEGAMQVADADGVAVDLNIMPDYRSATNDAWSAKSSTTFDRKGQLVESQSAVGRVTTYAYNGRGQLTRAKLYWSNDLTINFGDTEQSYDALGRPTQTKVHATTNPSTHTPYSSTDIVTSQTWTSHNQIDTATDALGRTTTLGYESFTIPNTSTTGYRLTSVTGPHGEAATTHYDSNGRVDQKTVLVSSGTYRTVAFAYDSAGNVQSSTVDPGSGHLALTTAYGYDTDGNMTSATDPLSHVTNLTYDAARRPLTTVGPEGSKIETVYFPNGQVDRVEVTRSGSGVGPAVTSYGYTPAGRLVTATDPEGQSWGRYYDELGNMTYEGRPGTSPIGYNYSADHERSRVMTGYGDAQMRDQYSIFNPDGSLMCAYDGVDFSAIVAGQTENSMGRVCYGKDAWGRTTHAQYGTGVQYSDVTLDAGGRPTQVRYRDASTANGGADRYATLAYDDANHTVSETTPTNSSGGWRKKNVTVNLAGDLSMKSYQSADGFGQVRWYGYDAAGRVTSETWRENYDGGSPSYTTGYEYDAGSNVTAIVWPDQYKATYAHDNQNRVTLVGWTRPSGGGSGTFATYTYNKQSMPTNVAYGATPSSPVANLALTLQASGRPYQAAWTFSGSSVTMGFGYTQAGKLNYQSINNAAFVWKPTAAETRTLSSTTMSGQAVNRYNQLESEAVTTTSTTNLTYTHDPRGNLTSNGSQVFTYDYDNQLEKVATSGGTTVATYGYDPNGQRTVKDVNGGAKTLFIHAGSTEIADLSSSGTVLRRYIPGPGADSWVAYVDEAGSSTKHVHQDNRGSVIALSDASSGVVSSGDIYTYDAYGDSPASTAGFPFRFTGQRLDPETGLYYYKARYYDPKQGRFLSNDPIGIASDRNMYAYAGGDPINFRDPSGLEGCETEENSDCGTGGVPNTGGSQNGSTEVAEFVVTGHRRPVMPPPNWVAAIDAGFKDFVPIEGGEVALTADAADAAAKVCATKPTAPTSKPPATGYAQPPAADAAIDATLGSLPKPTIPVPPFVLPGFAAAVVLLYSNTGGNEDVYRFYYHYGYLADASKFDQGLKPGGFVTNTPFYSGAEAQAMLALPDRGAPPDALYQVRVPFNVPVIGPTPVVPQNGQPGGGTQWVFPFGTPPNSVSLIKRLDC